MSSMHATTILSVRTDTQVAIAGDGQVSLGDTVVKMSARKIRRLYKEQVLVGFAGATADAFTLFERFEGQLEKYQGHLERSAVELAKEWRNDRILRRLEAMLIVADKTASLMISGSGDVLSPEKDVVAIGSGGNYARSAALALVDNCPTMKAFDIATKSLAIAADICVYTNHSIVHDVIDF